MTNIEFIRQHLLESLGVVEREKKPCLDSLKETEWCEAFERHRRYRMIMGALRYGLLSEPKKWAYDLMAGHKKKIRLYEETGNLEHLVDAANYLMLEFMKPSHANAHFRAEDDYNHCPKK